MRWSRVEASDKSSQWQESAISWGLEKFAFIFVVEESRRCWTAYFMVYDADIAIGEYATERAAKGACRRKAGAIINALKRGLRAI